MSEESYEVFDIMDSFQCSTSLAISPSKMQITTATRAHFLAPVHEKLSQYNSFGRQDEEP